MLNGAVCKSYVCPAILYGSETWCLKGGKITILQETDIQGASNVWSIAHG